MPERKKSTLKFPDDEAFRCLRSGELDRYQQLTAGRETIDFSDADLRGVDLRGIDTTRLRLRGAYLRDADLRGLDLRGVDLSGASMFHAKVSGVYFAESYAPDEIRMSLECGTRLRPKG